MPYEPVDEPVDEPAALTPAVVDGRDRGVATATVATERLPELPPLMDLAAASEPLDRATLLPTAVRYDRTLAATLAALASAEAAQATVRRWLAPSVGVGIENHSLRDDVATSYWGGGPQFTVTLRRAVAVAAERAQRAADVTAAEARVIDRYAQLQGNLTRAVAALERARTMKAAAERQQSLAAKAEVLAARRVEAGLSATVEQSMASFARIRAAVDVVSLSREETNARRSLEQALNLGPHSLPATITLAALPLPEGPAALPSLDDLHATALTRRGDVLGALALFARADANVRAAVAAQYPTLSLNPGYFFDQGDHVWSLFGSLALPLAVNQKPRIATAMAVREQRAKEFLAVQETCLQQVSSARVDLVQVLEARKAIRAMLIEHDARLAALNQQFEEGSVDELTLTRVHMESAQLAAEGARMDGELALAVAQLEQVSRLPFTDARLAELAGRFGALLEGAGRARSANPVSGEAP